MPPREGPVGLGSFLPTHDDLDLHLHPRAHLTLETYPRMTSDLWSWKDGGSSATRKPPEHSLHTCASSKCLPQNVLSFTE